MKEEHHDTAANRNWSEPELFIHRSISESAAATTTATSVFDVKTVIRRRDTGEAHRKAPTLQTLVRRRCNHLAKSIIIRAATGGLGWLLSPPPPQTTPFKQVALIFFCPFVFPFTAGRDVLMKALRKSRNRAEFAAEVEGIAEREGTWRLIGVEVGGGHLMVSWCVCSMQLLVNRRVAPAKSKRPPHVHTQTHRAR